MAVKFRKWRVRRMTNKQLVDYAMSHVTPVEGKTNIFLVHTPIKVFKKIKVTTWGGDAIASLLIPVGALIHIDFATWGHLAPMSKIWNLKMRASKAYIERIFDLDEEKDLRSGVSGWDRDFVYRVGKTVHPRGRFSQQAEVCTTGIHFFMELNPALDY